jgi:hypothetical protein
MMKSRALAGAGSLAILTVLGVAGSCVVREERPSTETSKSALATSNGLALNGLTTNGLWSNGLWSNGLWSNGLWSNGLWSNGLWSNGLWSNGLWSNGLTGTAAIPGDTLRNSSYARQLLQYIYACAMPSPTTDASGAVTSSYDTSLDPNNGSLTCSTSSPCDFGYTCSGGKCVVPLKGMIGLGINADGSTWWQSGTCDESCQRWVSACVLARTNAYGVHVQISMRAPTVTPLNHELQYAKIRAALATSPDEVVTYSFREGAYYGNLFATTPIDPATSLPATYPGTDGPATGPIASTPSFYACAGPDSNVPQITRRFCSSQGDQSVINVPGVCVSPVSAANVPSVCDGIDGTGSIYGCFTSTDTTQPRTHYDEVITVYLKQPISVCGDDVCDSPAEDSTSCPSDCHPTGWAKSFAGLITGSSGVAAFDYHGSSALSPIDDSVVLAGLDTDTFFTNIVGNSSLGGPLLPGTDGNLIVAKYSSRGDYLWGRRLSTAATRIEVTVTSDGRIVVGEWGTPGNIAGSISQLTADGQVVTDQPILTNDSAGGNAVASNIVADSLGNVIMAGTFDGTMHYKTGQGINHTLADSGTTTGFVLKVLPSGIPSWGLAINGNGSAAPTSLAVAPSGDVLVAAALGDLTGKVSTTNLLRLATADGTVTPLRVSPVWSPSAQVNFTAAAANGTSDVYATGSFKGSYDFGPGCGIGTTSMGSEFFLAKYSADGTQCRWVARPAMQCPAGAKFCNDGLFEGGALAFDSAGNVLVGGRLDPQSSGGLNRGVGGGALVDFGAGPFQSYTYPDAFVASYAPGGAFAWATQISMVLMGNLRAMHTDRQNNVVVSGTYTGSMEVDNRLLVDTVPELVTDAVANTYLASFAPPSAVDQTPPVIGASVDSDGTPISTIPRPIYMPAASANGTVVFFTLPTGTDGGNAGVTVTCAPPPNSLFPIGTTVVTCTATDARGNKASATFTVTVADRVGPAINQVSNITVQAPNLNGAVVTYTAPTSIDQIDGVRPVSCVPASGSVFVIGKTNVTCSATDRSNNLAQTTFVVNVLGLPLASVCTATSQCTNGICIDGVCCNTTATSCGQCYACNVPGSVGTCTATSGGSCTDGNACTQTDTCQAGTCVGANPVTCAAADQCHVAGVCNPATGACSNPPVANGTACSDGNACTRSDSCQAGTCVGANPVTCAAADQCHVAGVCNPATGACSNPAAPNGTTCSDGNACTQVDTCQTGACVGASPVTCTAADQCHTAGVCNPSTGTCSNPSAPDGTTCTDGNACTSNDTCSAGVCVAGPAVVCDDQNVCTVDSCNPTSGCVFTPGNAGTVCRGAANACDSAEVCTGTSAACPPNVDHQPPALAAGTDQVVVGTCSAAPLAFVTPALANGTCEAGTTVTCTSIPGNSYGAKPVTCTAKDASGNVSAAVSFTVTVLQPLTVVVQPPLTGDNNTVDNIVKVGSTVPNKVQLLACGVNVTTTASVVVKLTVAYTPTGGATVTSIVPAFNGKGDVNGVMVLDGANYRYNLDTKGYSTTASVPAFYQETVTVAYKSAPNVVVGSDAIEVDTQ